MDPNCRIGLILGCVFYGLYTSLPVKRQNGVLSLPEEMRFGSVSHCSGTGHCKLFSLVEAKIPLYS